MKRFFIFILAVMGIGLIIPQNLEMPVVGAGSHSYNHDTFGVKDGELLLYTRA